MADMNTGKQNEELYRVTFKSMLGMSLALSIIVFLLMLCGIIYKNLFMPILGIIFLVLLFVIRYRFKVIFDEKRISYTGLFATKTIMLTEVVHSGWMFEHGYSRDRFFGSFVYEILSKDNCIRINFRLFPLAHMTKVIQTLESLPRKLISDKEPPPNI